MKLTICIEYGYDEELPDITVEQVKKALQKFIVPSRALHVYEAVEHGVQPTLLRCPKCNAVAGWHHEACEDYSPETQSR